MHPTVKVIFLPDVVVVQLRSALSKDNSPLMSDASISVQYPNQMRLNARYLLSK